MSMVLTRFLGLLAALLMAFASPAGAQTPDSPPNFIIIFIDDVGPDQLSMFDAINPYAGSSDPFTDPLYVDAPNLQSLADSGVTFLNAYSTPVCSAARASLVTGRYQVQTGVGTVVRQDRVGDYEGGLAEFGDSGFEHTTLAQMAQSVGYHTAIIGKWHLSLPSLEMSASLGSPDWLGWEGIAQRGYWDEIRATFWNLDTEPAPSGNGGYYDFFWNVNGTVTMRTGEYATTVQLDEALEYCQSAPEPFVAYVPTNACHSPWAELPPANLVNTPEYLEGAPSAFKNFAAMLEALDTKVGDLVNGLSPERLERTVIVVMGDNGSDKTVIHSSRDADGFDLGATYDALIDDSEQRFKRSVYERGLRVPLIVSFPGIASPGRTSNALVHVTDIYATIADWSGAQSGSIDGVSFRPLLQDPSIGLAKHQRQSIRSDLFQNNGQPLMAANKREIGFSMRVSDGRRFKIRRVHEVPAATVVDEFYLLQDADGTDVDPFELNPLPIGQAQGYFVEYREVANALSPPEITTFCDSLPNSTGHPALIGYQGSPSLSAEDLVLIAQPVRPHAFGIFYYGAREIQLSFANGLRCVGAGNVGVFRLPITVASPSGVLSHPLEYDSPPTLPGAFHAGSIWKFQAWYRDVPGGGFASNLSDGLSVLFGP